MHINFDRFTPELSGAEIKHLKTCSECYEHFHFLNDLYIEAKTADSAEVPPDIWANIEATLPRKKHLFFSKTYLAMAASFLICAITYLSWSSYQIKQQLELVLNKNQQLEAELSLLSSQNLYFDSLNLELRQLENELNNVNDAQQKLEILNKRRLVLVKLIEIKKGLDNAYTI
ncbi:hypothetical protein [uncultured Psychrosphaera sp.]|uniref:hypothetical protein n=1 Tax=uncultured Psychrosphaera sp. TaxID=1403522 RepID=UPI0030F4DF19